MNTAFPDVIGGTTTSTVSPFVVTGTLPYARDPNVDLLNQYKGTYIIRYGDNATAGFECGYGVYDTTANTITTIKVFTSSSGDGVACSTFTSAAKHIGFTLSGNEIGNMARVYASKAPHEFIWGVGGGQSNAGNAIYAGATYPDNPNVLDYSFTNVSDTDIDWRVIDVTQDYTASNTAYYAANNDLGLGCGRSSGAFRSNGTLQSWARKTQLFTGRKVLTLNSYCSWTSISEADKGWLYARTNNPLTHNSAEHLNKRIGEATTAIVSLYPEQAGIKPDVFIFMHGETDSAAPMSSATYGWLLYDFLQACRDSTRWGWAKYDMQVYLTDISEHWRRKNYNGWAGHAVAKQYYGDNCTVIDTQGLVPYDGAHYAAEEHDKLAQKIFNAQTNIGSSFSSQGIFSMRRTLPLIRPVGQSSTTLAYRITDGDAAPASGQYRHKATGFQGILLHKTQALFSTVDAYASGFANLRPGETFVMTTFGGVAADNYTYTVTGPITYADPILTVPCTWASGGGTPPGTAPTLCTMTSLYGMWLPENTAATTDLMLQVSPLKTPTAQASQAAYRDHLVYIDDERVLQRSLAHTPLVQRKHTSNTGTFDLWSSPALGVGMMYFDFVVLGRSGTDTAKTYVAKFQALVNVAGQQVTVLWNSDLTPLRNATDPWPSCTLYGSATNVLYVRNTGKASTEIEWTVQAQPIEPMVGV